MIDPTQLLLFCVTTVLLIFTPGPDIIYVMTRGMTQGRRAALAAATGFALGNFVHTFAAIVGLSALITSSATAYALVRYAGALYLVYLGVRLFRSKASLTGEAPLARLEARVIFRQSVLANVMNPKVALFFLAFFPQFIDRSRGSVPLQMLILGTTFVLLTQLCFSLVALGAGAIGAWLNRKRGFGARAGQFAGSILIGLGLRLAWPQR